MRNKLASLALLLTAAIWGTSFAVSQMALDEGLSPFQMMTCRFLISSILMIVMFWKEVKKIRIKEVKAGMAIGTFLFLGFAFQTFGLKYTTPSKNAFITATNVVMVPLIYWLIKKKRPDKYSLVGALLTIIGISLLTLEGSFKVGLGDWLTLISAVAFALQIISIGYYAKKHLPIQLMTIQMLTNFVLSLVALLFTQDAVSLTSKGWLTVLYLGIPSTTIAFLVQNIAQKYVSASKTAIILATESVFGTISSVIFIGESLNTKMIAGCVIIFVAIMITEVKPGFKNRRSSELREC